MTTRVYCHRQAFTAVSDVQTRNGEPYVIRLHEWYDDNAGYTLTITGPNNIPVHIELPVAVADALQKVLQARLEPEQ